MDRTTDPIAFVTDFIQAADLEVRFDGSLFSSNRPLMAETPEMVAGYLNYADVDAPALADQMLLHVKQQGLDFSKGDIDRALREVIRLHQHQRLNTVLRPLLPKLPEEQNDKADQAWSILATKLFELDPTLTASILQHFIFQVKQKVLGRPVAHHLMPIVVSSIQGSGKTTFVRKFLSPLRELATGAALLSDFADRRSGDIYRFPVVLIDDMEQIAPPMIPILKQVLSADGLRRRRLHTSTSIGIRQRASLIGTANSPIEQLVADETGHRRFAMLPFRNGQVAKGGDPDVWRTVTSTDFELLWRSVDAFGPCPIERQLDNLYRHQRGGRAPASLGQWLRNLDLKSEEMLQITTRRGVRSQGLYELYLSQSGREISPPRFAIEMGSHARDPDVPLGVKFKTEIGMVYPIKRGVLGKNTLTSESSGPSDPACPADPAGGGRALAHA